MILNISNSVHSVCNFLKTGAFQMCVIRRGNYILPTIVNYDWYLNPYILKGSIGILTFIKVKH